MYMFCIGTCIRCRQTFTFNPDRVPSIRVTPDSPKEPVCRDCFDALNRVRVSKGLEPWAPPLEGAYDAQETA